MLGLIEAGWSTRAVGRELGLTATQVSTIWRRTRPARGPGNPAGRTDGDATATAG